MNTFNRSLALGVQGPKKWGFRAQIHNIDGIWALRLSIWILGPLGWGFSSASEGLYRIRVNGEQLYLPNQLAAEDNILFDNRDSSEV